jgi:hypothetical protein
MGVSASQESEESAMQQALSECQAHSQGKLCDVRIAYNNQCVAVAPGGSRMARSPDLKDAEDTALSNCQKSTTNSDIILFRMHLCRTHAVIQLANYVACSVGTSK